MIVKHDALSLLISACGLSRANPSPTGRSCPLPQAAWPRPHSGAEYTQPGLRRRTTAEDMDGVGVAGRFGTTQNAGVGHPRCRPRVRERAASVTLTGGLTTGGLAYRFAVLNDAGKFRCPIRGQLGWRLAPRGQHGAGEHGGVTWQAAAPMRTYMSKLDGRNRPVDLNASARFSPEARSAPTRPLPTSGR